MAGAGGKRCATVGENVRPLRRKVATAVVCPLAFVSLPPHLEKMWGPANIQKTFGLGTSGQWVKLGKGVLGRVMPFGVVVVVFETIVAMLLAWVAPDQLIGWAFAALGLDFLMFALAIVWAHLHPAEAASEGKEIAEIRHAEATAMKALGHVPPSPNVPDPLTIEGGPPLVGELTAEASATMPEPLALPDPQVSARRKKG